MSADYTIHQFIADCETLLARHGEPGSKFVGGTLRNSTPVFETPGLVVVGGKGKELEIRIIYRRPDDSHTTDNPVVLRAEDGEIYRTHGEWSYAKRRVARLMGGESPEEPIQLGKGESGWTEGLD